MKPLDLSCIIHYYNSWALCSWCSFGNEVSMKGRISPRKGKIQPLFPLFHQLGDSNSRVRDFYLSMIVSTWSIWNKLYLIHFSCWCLSELSCRNPPQPPLKFSIRLHFNFLELFQISYHQNLDIRTNKAQAPRETRPPLRDASLQI